jgi:hypothetical protein
MDSLQNEFSNAVQFILIGYTGSQYGSRLKKEPDDKPIRTLFERIKKVEKLNLSIAYDSLFFHRFNIGACPYIIVVDPTGIVQGITTSLSSDELKSLLARKKISLRKAYRKGER